MLRPRLILLLIAGSGCAGHSSPPPPLPEPLTAELRPMSGTSVAMNCLSRKGDSLHFHLAIVVDSITARTHGTIDVARSPRSAPRPGVVNQVVSAHFNQAGSTKVQGTACWHDSGVVFRAPAAILDGGTLILDPRDRLEISIYDDRGRVVGAAQVLALPYNRARAQWTAVPPNEEL